MRSEVLRLMTELKPPVPADVRVNRIGNDIVRVEPSREARFDRFSMRSRLVYKRHPRLKFYMAAAQTTMVFVIALVASRFGILPRLWGVFAVLIPMWLMGLALQNLFVRQYRFAAVIELRPRGLMIAEEEGEPLELILDASQIADAIVDERYGTVEITLRNRKRFDGAFNVPTGVIFPTGLWGPENADWLREIVELYTRGYWKLRPIDGARVSQAK